MKKVFSKEGKIYIGDPCYAMKGEHYSYWGEEYNYSDGIHTIDDFNFAVHGTEFGDGAYFGSDGKMYAVDSGTIAIIPLELTNGEFGNLGSLVDADEATLLYQNGDFIIETVKDEKLQDCITICTGYDADAERY